MSFVQYQSCIEKCMRCAQECGLCADAKLADTEPRAMAECIRMCHDCADVCWMAASLMSRRSCFADEMCRTAASICDGCEAECARHPEDEDCQRCIKACQHCAEECRSMLFANV